MALVAIVHLVHFFDGIEVAHDVGRAEGFARFDRLAVDLLDHDDDVPRALAAPLHRHNREDEYSFVLQGRMGALLGDEVVEAGVGDLVFKPRKQWHTFWNASDEPCRILEIISPAGFERFFAELVNLGGVGGAEPQTLADLCARYELEMRPDTVPELIQRFKVHFPGEEILAGWPRG